MARFLFTVQPIPGHFYPQLAIAQALSDRGHKCAFYTGCRMGRILKSEGFEHFFFRKVDEEKLLNTLFPPQREPMHPLKINFMAVLRKSFLESIPGQVEDLEPILSRWQPDVIACDPTVWGPILVLQEKHGIPVAISSFCPACMVPGPEVAPFGLGLPRPRNWYTRLLSQVASLGMDLVTVNFRRQINVIRWRYGLTALTMSLAAFTGTMPLYLVPGVPELDYQRGDLPPSVRYVGQLVRQKRPEDKPPEWLSRLPREHPWVYATEGTVHVSTPILLRAAAQGLGNLPIELIMITGDDRDPAQLNLEPISPNVHVARWVWPGDVLPHVKVTITTGGPGSVLASLSAGVPVIIVPTEWDKPEIAQRLVDAGAGLRLTPGNCTPRRMRAAVERVLREESFSQNAQRLAQIFKSYTGASRAADLLEELAESNLSQELRSTG
jgi:MGT family glycosyltransferase